VNSVSSAGEKGLFEAEEDHQEQKPQYDPTG
jgi:hypothetical protein